MGYTGYVILGLSAAAALADRRPKLVIAGERDRIAPPVQLQRAIDGLRGHVRYVELRDADHGMLGHEESIAKTAVDFLAEVLGVRSGAPPGG